jgi:hypothetical protein
VFSADGTIIESTLILPSATSLATEYPKSTDDVDALSEDSPPPTQSKGKGKGKVLRSPTPTSSDGGKTEVNDDDPTPTSTATSGAPIKYAWGKHPNSRLKPASWPKLEVNLRNVHIEVNTKRKVEKVYNEMTTDEVQRLRREWNTHCNILKSTDRNIITRPQYMGNGKKHVAARKKVTDIYDDLMAPYFIVPGQGASASGLSKAHGRTVIFSNDKLEQIIGTKLKARIVKMNHTIGQAATTKRNLPQPPLM